MFSKPYSAGPFLSGLNLWWQNSAFICLLNPKMPSLFFVLFNFPLSPSAGSCLLVLRGTFGAEEHCCGCSVSTVTRCCSLSCFVPPLFPSLLHLCLECCVLELCAHCSPGSHCSCCDDAFLSDWKTNLQKAPGSVTVLLCAEAVMQVLQRRQTGWAFLPLCVLGRTEVGEGSSDAILHRK